MSEQQNLILNLNQMMEECVGISREETTPKLYTVAIQDERAKTRMKIEQQPEESRKRKRNAEESETEQREDVEVDDLVFDDLVSETTHVVMEQTLLYKDFIGERGFNKIISPFREEIEKRGWNLLCEHIPVGFAAVVREFFANLVDKKERNCYVRGKWISFNRKEINRTYNMKQ